jgi:hypothetical protein
MDAAYFMLVICEARFNLINYREIGSKRSDKSGFKAIYRIFSKTNRLPLAFETN